MPRTRERPKELAGILLVFVFCFKILFTCQGEREQEQGEPQAQGKAGSPPSKELEARLDPRTPGS